MTTATETKTVATNVDLIEAGLDHIGLTDEKARIQVTAAYEIMMMDRTGETKAAISKRLGISTRSLDRYAQKFEEQAYEVLDFVNSKQEDDADAEVNETPEAEVPEPATAPEVKAKAEPKAKAKAEEKSSEPTVDLEEFESRGIKPRLVEELKVKGVDQSRGRKMTKSMEEREFWMDMSRFSDEEKALIQKNHLRLIFKVGGHKRTQKPKPEAILRYDEMKREGQTYEKYLENVMADGLTEKEAVKHFQLAKVYAEVPDKK